MAWVEKSRSDTDVVYAEVEHGRETGVYRYEFADGRRKQVDYGAPPRPVRLKTRRLLAILVGAGLGAAAAVTAHALV